jgi:hypothetical protein
MTLGRYPMTLGRYPNAIKLATKRRKVGHNGGWDRWKKTDWSSMWQ